MAYKLSGRCGYVSDGLDELGCVFHLLELLSRFAESLLYELVGVALLHYPLVVLHHVAHLLGLDGDGLGRGVGSATLGRLLELLLLRDRWVVGCRRRPDPQHSLRRREASSLVVLSVSLLLDYRFKLLVEIVFILILHLHRLRYRLRRNGRLARRESGFLELLDLHVTLFVLRLELVELFREIGSRFLKLES